MKTELQISSSTVERFETKSRISRTIIRFCNRLPRGPACRASPWAFPSVPSSDSRTGRKGKLSWLSDEQGVESTDRLQAARGLHGFGSSFKRFWSIWSKIKRPELRMVKMPQLGVCHCSWGNEETGFLANERIPFFWISIIQFFSFLSVNHTCVRINKNFFTNWIPLAII
jgi:hypothetical protein